VLDKGLRREVDRHLMESNLEFRGTIDVKNLSQVLIEDA